jgi:uncharacterized membrane protein YcaP (DUF421 family)
MVTTLYTWLSSILGLGLDQNTLLFKHMAVRAVVVYSLGILLVRVGKRRFLAKPTPFDLVLVLMFGSVMSRAITGNGAFFPTLGAGCVLIILHRIFSLITYYSSSMGAMLKGSSEVLIKNGQVQWESMRRNHITQKDLISALRRSAKLADPKDVKLATLERNGEISVIPQPQRIETVHVPVKEGVQVVRIDLYSSSQGQEPLLE